MGCASAKHVSTVQNEEEVQKGKNYQNGDVFGDEYRIKPVEEVKYMKNGGEDDQKIAARNQENLEKSASSNVRLKSNKEVPGLVHQPRANMHISESQQEFFRMLDEKIEKKPAETELSILKYCGDEIENERVLNTALQTPVFALQLFIYGKQIL
ncbi:uncharacterized protein C1orf21 homolog isoform X1 [Gopherus evgoodei]|uniref:Uncharacterized protein n=1 Tax=Gopherus evgoodei TaxID=1825980 RepID=A0A8C4YGI5_9SAUR|nr:uncharacterized protein C1orf21 homolog isoform X1 [Gopherus evgoodei]XP_030428099.1 uncharacterized protein C1orf21 homolog isoform X1 [Gopherus evgoodei]